MLVDDDQLAELRHAYQVLGVPTDSSEPSIRKAYRRLVKRWHPDLYPNGTLAHVEATHMTRLMNEAYSAIAHAPLRYHTKTYPNQARERSWQTPSPLVNEPAWINYKQRYGPAILFSSLAVVYFLYLRTFDRYPRPLATIRLAIYSSLALWSLPKEWKSLLWWGVFALGISLAWYMSFHGPVAAP